MFVEMVMITRLAGLGLREVLKQHSLVRSQG